MVPLKSLQFPIQYLDVCDALISSHGYDVQNFHAQCAVSHEDLLNQTKMIDGEQLLQAYTLTQQYCTPDRPAVLQILEHFPLTAHGMLGMLALASRTLENALNAAIEFFPLVMPAFKVNRQNVGNQVHLNFELVTDFGDQNHFFTELIIGALHGIMPFMLTPISEIRVQFAHTLVGDFAAYEAFFQLNIQHGAGENRIMIPRALLKIPIMTQSPTLQRLLETDLRAKTQINYQQPISQQVRRLLRLFLNEHRVIVTEAVAQQLNMSYRTLIRKLSNEGTSFRQLLDEVRVSYAEELIKSTTKPISEIAQRLGFSTSANFSRTFKRVTGKIPSDYRLAHTAKKNIRKIIELIIIINLA